jgi:hypothetical protein
VGEGVIFVDVSANIDMMTYVIMIIDLFVLLRLGEHSYNPCGSFI